MLVWRHLTVEAPHCCASTKIIHQMCNAQTNLTKTCSQRGLPLLKQNMIQPGTSMWDSHKECKVSMKSKCKPLCFGFCIW